MSFQIWWSVPDDQWRKLQIEGERIYSLDPRYARIELLEGFLQLRAGDRPLFPPESLQLMAASQTGPAYDSEQLSRQGVKVSMIDFAYQLIPIVDEFELSAARFGQDRRFSSSDSSLEIVFLLLEQGIRIESNWAQYPPGWQIMTTLTEIQRGAKPFFYDLVIQIQRWAPNALDWEELVGLKRYLDHIDG